MKKLPSVLCIGSALWDTIARADHPLHTGADVPGHISRQLGGVALNVAVALADRGIDVAILSAVGNDLEGDTLIRAAEARGIDCSYVTRGEFPTDNYLAVEGSDGEVFSAVADCRSLEELGAEILSPLKDGRLGSVDAHFPNAIIVDGNLSEAALADFASFHIGATDQLTFVPASPGKARRLADTLKTCGGTLFANRVEVEILCNHPAPTSVDAACAIRNLGACAIITDSANPATMASDGALITATPPDVTVTSVTGAGDAFLAGFMVAKLAGQDPQHCLNSAVASAADHISRDIIR